MVALGLGLAARTLLGAGQLLETTVKRFHLPAPQPRVDDHFPRQLRGQVISNYPVNAAVWGNQLDEAPRERYFLPSPFGTGAPAPRRWFERVEALLARFFADAP